MPTLTLVDTLGIQSFVFASNRLKDVIGGSELVYQATSPKGWIQELGYQDNMIVGAGGNLLLRFDDSGQARSFAAQYSRRMLDKAPGLEIALVHHEYADGQLAEAIQAIQVKIEKRKCERCPSVPLLGLGVTATCRETQHPATSLDGEGIPIAKGIDVRRRDKNQERWHKFLPADAFQRDGGETVKLAFPMELDDLGRSHGDTSFVGVIHIDGNGIGQKLKDWLDDRVQDRSEDTKTHKEYQEFSIALDRLTKKVFERLIERIIAAIRWDTKQGGYVLQRPSWQQGFALRCVAKASSLPELFLPVRPILLGGDDFTLVCDGRIALDLATAALTEFEQTPPLDHLGVIRACAGVALVKTHAPFARAYGLAESLCTSAKSWLREHDRQNQSALDWHIGLASSSETLRTLRQRQYNIGTDSGDKLTCRPYPLCQYSQMFEPSWHWLTKKVLGTTNKGFRSGLWQVHRSKLKELRELARDGSDSVKDAFEAWRVAHPSLALPDNIEKGFWEDQTPLLDALELLDIHHPLD